MADNVEITAGSGTTVSTEEVTSLNGGAVSAQHIQRVGTAFRTGDGAAYDAATGAGAVDSATQRVTLASDDPAVTTLDSMLTELQSVATGIPRFDLEATSDLTPGNVSRTGAGETTMVAAVSGQTTRLHRYAVTVPGDGTIEIRDGASGTVKRKHVFTGLRGIERVFDARPYAITSTNTALVFYWSGSGEANIDFDYVTSA